MFTSALLIYVLYNLKDAKLIFKRKRIVCPLCHRKQKELEISTRLYASVSFNLIIQQYSYTLYSVLK